MGGGKTTLLLSFLKASVVKVANEKQQQEADSPNL
jgi:hypothetical protein